MHTVLFLISAAVQHNCRRLPQPLAAAHAAALSLCPPTCTAQASGTNLNAPDLVSGEHKIPHSIRTVSQKTYRKLLAGALEHMTTREDFYSFSVEFATIIEKRVGDCTKDED
jgi:hypothetical protein